MNAAGSTTPRAVPLRRVPLWLMVLASLGVILVLGGSLTVLLNSPETTFGWFANAPASDEAIPTASWVASKAIAGWVRIAVGLILGAFCAGWLMGRRHHLRIDNAGGGGAPCEHTDTSGR